jgi:23S rRNA (cytosine1962-C5)-methyltransferase
MQETLNRMPQVTILTSPDWKDYELIDTGNGAKLERYGPYRFLRPEPEAVWHPALPEKEWKSVDAVFKPSPEENGGHWENQRELKPRWMMEYKGLKFWVATTNSRHLGVFPEQASQWDWIQERVFSASRPPAVLNLFGYTGLASVAAAQAGARVTHIDASRKVVTWAHDNLKLTGVDEDRARWIVDDAIKFIQREARRKSQYDGIILDPPKFGRGPKGEVWEFYRLLPDLLEACRQILTPKPLFVVLTAYAVKTSSITLAQAMQEMTAGLKGSVSAGEVALVEKSAGRVLSMAVFARWSSDHQK